MNLDINWVKARIKNDEYEFSSHADRERENDKISVFDLENALLRSQVLEKYPQWINEKTRRKKDEKF